MPLLEIRDLKLEFGTGERSVRAVDGVSFSLEKGETLGLVGESGCGKSITAQAITRLVPSPPVRYTGGEILLEGRNVLIMAERELRQIRGRVVSYIFQDPGVSLNPVIRVGRQIAEAIRLHRPGVAMEAEVVRLLKLVGIPSPEARRKSYPHELSGGMQQRVMIAMALASHPQLLIADEPTTALDMTIQAQILDLLRDVKQRLNMSMLLITHNLGIVGEIADRVAVMYAGEIVELAPAHALLQRPLHPYTRGLMASVPRLESDQKRLQAIPGSVPPPGEMPPGCRFHPRCPHAATHPECALTRPPLVEVEPDRWVRCFYANELSMGSNINY